MTRSNAFQGTQESDKRFWGSDTRRPVRTLWRAVRGLKKPRVLRITCVIGDPAGRRGHKWCILAEEFIGYGNNGTECLNEIAEKAGGNVIFDWNWKMPV